MARIWSSGAELNTLTANGEVTGTSGNVSIQTGIVRSGIYAFQHNQNSGEAEINYQLYGGNTQVKLFVRVYIYFSQFPGGLRNFIDIEDSSGNASLLIRINSSNQLVLTNGASTIGSPSAALNLNQWYRLEALIDSSPANGFRSLELLLNGSSIASSIGNLTMPSAFKIRMGIDGNPATSWNWYSDDIAINDDSGSFQNSYPGAGGIVHLQPNASGDHNDFTIQVGGTAGASNNYTRVSEVTPDDTTSYNGDTLSGDIDDFNLANTPSSIGNSDTINVVQVGIRHRAIIASGESPFVVRAKKTSGGTVSEGSIITPNSTSWNTNSNAAPHNYPLTLYQDPDSANWTKTTLDTAQIGYRITSIGTNATDVSTVWMLIDFTSTAVLINISESITISENITVVETTSGIISVSDSVITSENINTTIIETFSISDSLTSQEKVDVFVDRNINLNSDLVSINEAITISPLPSIIVNDSVTILENITRMKSIQEIMPSSSSGEHQGVKIWTT